MVVKVINSGDTRRVPESPVSVIDVFCVTHDVDSYVTIGLFGQHHRIGKCSRLHSTQLDRSCTIVPSSVKDNIIKSSSATCTSTRSAAYALPSMVTL